MLFYLKAVSVFSGKLKDPILLSFLLQLAEVLLKLLYYQISHNSMNFEIKFDSPNDDDLSSSPFPDSNKNDDDNNEEYEGNEDDDEVSDLIKDFDKLEL